MIREPHGNYHIHPILTVERLGLIAVAMLAFATAKSIAFDRYTLRSPPADPALTYQWAKVTASNGDVSVTLSASCGYKAATIEVTGVRMPDGNDATATLLWEPPGENRLFFPRGYAPAIDPDHLTQLAALNSSGDLNKGVRYTSLIKMFGAVGKNLVPPCIGSPNRDDMQTAADSILTTFTH